MDTVCSTVCKVKLKIVRARIKKKKKKYQVVESAVKDHLCQQKLVTGGDFTGNTTLHLDDV